MSALPLSSALKSAFSLSDSRLLKVVLENFASQILSFSVLGPMSSGACAVEAGEVRSQALNKAVANRVTETIAMFFMMLFSLRIPRSLHNNLRRVAPRPELAAGADGGDAHPEDRAGREAAEGDFAAGALRRGLPIRLHVRIARAGLRDVEAVLPVRREAGDDAAAEGTGAQFHTRGRGGDGAEIRPHARADGVGGEAAQQHDGGVALGEVIHIAAQLVQRALERGARGLEGEHIGARIAGAAGELRGVGADECGQRHHRDGRGGEGGGVREHLVVDGLGDVVQLGGDVAGEINNGFRDHGLEDGLCAVPLEARRPACAGGVPFQGDDFGFQCAWV